MIGKVVFVVLLVFSMVGIVAGAIEWGDDNN